jgi:hypothetical protein
MDVGGTTGSLMEDLKSMFRAVCGFNGSTKKLLLLARACKETEGGLSDYKSNLALLLDVETGIRGVREFWHF